MAQHRVCGSNTVCIQDLTYIICTWLHVKRSPFSLGFGRSRRGLQGFSKRALAERAGTEAVVFLIGSAS